MRRRALRARLRAREDARLQQRLEAPQVVVDELVGRLADRLGGHRADGAAARVVVDVDLGPPVARGLHEAQLAGGLQRGGIQRAPREGGQRLADLLLRAADRDGRPHAGRAARDVVLDALAGAAAAVLDERAVRAGELDRGVEVEQEEAAHDAHGALQALGVAALVAVGLHEQPEVHRVAEDPRPHPDPPLAVGHDVQRGEVLAHADGEGPPHGLGIVVHADRPQEPPRGDGHRRAEHGAPPAERVREAHGADAARRPLRCRCRCLVHP